MGNIELDDRCDLDPNKICDNCCKCLEPRETYNTVTAAFQPETIEEADEEEGYAALNQNLSAFSALFGDFEEYMEDAEEEDFEDALRIDPELVAEWEARLAAYEQMERQKNPARRLRGVRRSKEP